MKILVTGSSGHLGEALMRLLQDGPHDVVGLDVLASDWTTEVGSIVDPDVVDACMAGVDAVLHTATLHKPHVVTHGKQAFVDVNITGTLNLLEAAVRHGVSRFVFTSTTSVYSRRCSPGPGQPAVWVSEDLAPLPKNIYGVTKLAAEGLCELFAFRDRLPCLVLRTSRFFPEDDDRAEVRRQYSGDNAKVNELLYRRVDLQDAATAHLCAMDRAPDLGFGRYIVTAPTPLTPDDVHGLRHRAPGIVQSHVPFQDTYDFLGWRMPTDISRVYDSQRARTDLGWRPEFDFARALHRIRAGRRPFSDLTYAVGSKGYHEQTFVDGPFPTDDVVEA